MLPTCGADTSLLTVRQLGPWGQPPSQVLSHKCFFGSEDFGHHFLVLLILAYLGTSKDIIMVPECLSRKGLWQATCALSHCDDGS